MPVCIPPFDSTIPKEHAASEFVEASVSTTTRLPADMVQTHQADNSGPNDTASDSASSGRTCLWLWTPVLVIQEQALRIRHLGNISARSKRIKDSGLAARCLTTECHSCTPQSTWFASCCMDGMEMDPLQRHCFKGTWLELTWRWLHCRPWREGAAGCDLDWLWVETHGFQHCIWILLASSRLQLTNSSGSGT